MVLKEQRHGAELQREQRATRRAKEECEQAQALLPQVQKDLAAMQTQATTLQAALLRQEEEAANAKAEYDRVREQMGAWNTAVVAMYEDLDTAMEAASGISEYQLRGLSPVEKMRIEKVVKEWLGMYSRLQDDVKKNFPLDGAENDSTTRQRVLKQYLRPLPFVTAVRDFQ